MPHFENRISLGNILIFVGMAVPTIVALANVSAQASENQRELLDHEARLRVVETRIGDTLARIDERLSSIERKLREESAK